MRPTRPLAKNRLYAANICAKLIKLHSNLAKDPICVTAQYFGLPDNIVFKLPILYFCSADVELFVTQAAIG